MAQFNPGPFQDHLQGEAFPVMSATSKVATNFTCKLSLHMQILQAGDLPYLPKKIISLVPSQTELLHFLGLDDEVIGITKFCVHPRSWFSTRTRIGGTKTLNLKLIKELQPDLVIANKEENIKGQVEAIAAEFPVWVTDVNNLDQALGMIKDIGNLTGKVAAAVSLANEIKLKFSQPGITGKIRTAYLIWRHPYMAAGGDCFIHDMMKYCGMENVFAEKPRYPVINVQELEDAGTQLILLSSEPYPFSKKHVYELENEIRKGKHASKNKSIKIRCVDGEMFSWYGSRLLESAKYFSQLISEEQHGQARISAP